MSQGKNIESLSTLSQEDKRSQSGGEITREKIERRWKMKLEYRSSVEKWESLTKIALFEFDDEKLAWLCQEVADYIKSKGDVSLPYIVEYNIETIEHFIRAIYTSYRHPCPHCVRFCNNCRICPLRGDRGLCCDGKWRDVVVYLKSILEDCRRVRRGRLG